MASAAEPFNAVVQRALDGIVLIDARSCRLLFANAAFCRMLGYSPGEIEALQVKDLHPAQDLEEVLRAFGRPGEGRTDVFRVRRRDGSVFFADITLACFESEQGPVVAAFFRDAGARNDGGQRPRVPAPTDVLTGLANRREFVRLVELEMDRARRYGTPVGLILFQLDEFARIDEEVDQSTVDRVLQDVSRTTKNNIRSSDIAARWSAAVFAVMTPHSNLYAATRVAEKLRAAIARHPFDHAGKITVCAGVTEYVPGEASSALLARADDALLQAQAGGSDRVEAAR